MHAALPAAAIDADDEYRAIEQALIETARGRWFLAEHGRRARRLDSALLEDAIGRLKHSLRQPPALLGQLRTEIEEINAYLAEVKAELLARGNTLPASDTADAAQALATAPGAMPVRGILSAAEELHEAAWRLQSNEIDPDGCEAIARRASMIYALSHRQAIESRRTQRFTEALEVAAGRLAAILETVRHEMLVDGEQSTPPPA